MLARRARKKLGLNHTPAPTFPLSRERASLDLSSGMMILTRSTTASASSTTARRRGAAASRAPTPPTIDARRRRRRTATTTRATPENNNTTPQQNLDPAALLARAPAALVEAVGAAVGSNADPILKTAAAQPGAFLGGAFAALLQLDDSRDPLREWIERTREVAGLPPPSAYDYDDEEE